MREIIMPGSNGKTLWVPGKQETVLKFELQGQTIDLKMKGDINVIMQMIYQALETDKEIKLTVITAVLMWADQNGIQKDLLTEHSYLNPKNL